LSLSKVLLESEKQSYRYQQCHLSRPYAIYGDPMQRTIPDVTQWLISNGTGARASRCFVTPPRKLCRRRLCV
jgi:hypothetical protein